MSTVTSSQKGLSDRMREAGKRLSDWVWNPPEKGQDKYLLALRAAIRVLFIVVMEFKKDSIPLRASALTYIIVLSLVPMLALGTAVLKGLGAGDQMREAAYQIIQQFEGSSSQPRAPSPMGNSDHTEAKGGNPPPGLGVHLRTAVDKVFDYVERTNFATLGAIGIIGLLFSVISVLGSIEQAMNHIWQAEAGRPLGRKIMDYLALMILLPISVNVGLAAQATLESPKLLSRIQGFLPTTWILPLMLKMVPFIILIATFTILYRFIPNIKVGILPAVAGGIASGVAWLLVQGLYVRLQIGVARYNAIYGSFATLPLFLIWIYVGWIIFLTGAEISFSIQNWKRFIPKGDSLDVKIRLSLAFDMLKKILADFEHRQVTEYNTLVHYLGVPEGQVSGILKDLVRQGLIRKVDGQDEAYMPPAPADKIMAAEVVDALCGKNTLVSTGGEIVREFFDSARKAIGNRNLAILFSQYENLQMRESKPGD